ncbi:MAG: PG0541 family transporter-associated protein [Candidatus Omnitrophota bacterium]|jgi:nitrogen regulatory protein PII
MKMVMIVYNEAIDDEVMGALTASGIENFTKWQRVLGQGKISGPHLDSSVWPGVNNVCMTVVEDGKVKPLLEQVKGLRKHLGKEGVKAFVLPVEEVAE